MKWIKIKNEKQLKDLEISYKSYHGALCEFVYESTFNRDSLLTYYKWGELTHYMPIQKPESPLLAGKTKVIAKN